MDFDFTHILLTAVPPQDVRGILGWVIVAACTVALLASVAYGVADPQHQWKRALKNGMKQGGIAFIAFLGFVLAAYTTTRFTPEPAVDCVAAEQGVVSIMSEHPEAWRPLSASNPQQRLCGVNDVAKRVKAPRK